MSDREIKKKVEEMGMIEPFVPTQVRTKPSPLPDEDPERIVSYGLSSYGYDIRCNDEFKVFSNMNPRPLDPKNFPEESFTTYRDNLCVIPPNSFLLTRSLEYIKVPRDVLVICLGKSTYARCGIIVNVTPLEPEWEGYITMEVSNTTPIPAKIYANEGIAQLLFLKADDVCMTSYKDKKGKYQGQKGITLAKV